MRSRIRQYALIVLVILGVVSFLPGTGAAEAALYSTSYSGTNVGGPVFNRAVGCLALSGVGTAVNYHVVSVIVPETGIYAFDSVQDYDGYLTLYVGAFNPANPLANCLADNDDGFGGIGTSNLSAFLEAGAEYFLVTSAFANGQVGNFTNTISGPHGFAVPNKGEVTIYAGSPVTTYAEPGGEAVNIGGGQPLILPADADGNGFDTYLITDIVELENGQKWYGLFVGSNEWVYVNAAQVARTR